MTLRKRLIVCLDVDHGRVVKGVQFQNLRDVGDPVELAARYEAAGADEVVFLDISASHEDRDLMLDVVQRTAEQLFVPLTVGGGIRTADDMRAALNAGADKVAVNTAALQDPRIITACSKRFGAQCVVVAVDGKKAPGGGWTVWTHGGRNDTGKDALEWCKEAERLGAGEILLTSMDCDGMQEGYDIPLTQAVSEAVNIPVIASGGCGNAEHVVEVLQSAADAALAASIFHDGLTTIEAVKTDMAAAGVPVRQMVVHP